MSWCPKCKGEYRPEFEVCPQCRTRLVQQYPGEDLPQEQLQWVLLLQVAHPSQLYLLCQALKQAQIPFRHEDLEHGGLVPAVLGGGALGAVLYVPKQYVFQATQIAGRLEGKQSSPLIQDEAELDWEDWPQEQAQPPEDGAQGLEPGEQAGSIKTLGVILGLMALVLLILWILK